MGIEALDEMRRARQTSVENIIVKGFVGAAVGLAWPVVVPYVLVGVTKETLQKRHGLQSVSEGHRSRTERE